MPRRAFDDLTEGERLNCRLFEMTREEMIGFARRYDPQPFHVDEEKAKASVFGGLVASSLHTLATCTRVVVDALGELEIVSGVGMGEVKMHRPVRPGDRLEVDARWTDLRRSRSRRDRGYGTLACRVSNQKGELVIEYSYRYLIARREG